MRTKPLFFLKIFAVTIVVVLLAVYFFIQAKPFLSGPKISLDYPQNGQVFSESYIKIGGTVFNTKILLLNDHTILADSFGHFEENLLLAEGYNIIELSAEDRFGKITNKKLEVVLK